MRKRILLLLLITISLNSFSQSLKNRDIDKIGKLGITSTYNLTSQKTITDFSTILKLDKRRKTNKTFGILTTSLAALSYGYGAMILITNKDTEGTSKAVSNILGGTSMGIGTVFTLVSFKLFNSSKKQKSKRNKILSIYR